MDIISGSFVKRRERETIPHFPTEGLFVRLDLGLSLSLRFFRSLLMALVLLFLLLALVLLSSLLALWLFFFLFFYTFVFSLERPRTMNSLPVNSKGTESGNRRRKAFENENEIKEETDL